MIYKELKFDIDVDAIKRDIAYIETLTPYEKHQICLQHADVKSWSDGVPSYYQNKEIEDETSYVNWHEELNGTYIKNFLESLDFPVCHTRIMKIPERSCYTTHVDYHTRYHIPVVTNPLKTFMVFPDKGVILRMYPGIMYWTDTYELHNFLNGDITERIHIVFNNANEQKNLDNPYLRM